MPPEKPISLAMDRAEPVGFRSWLRVPWECVRMGVCILYWGVFGSLLTLIGGPLHAVLPKETGERLGRRFLHYLFRWFVALLRMLGLVKVDSSALQILAKSEEPLIIAPNHIALWDAVFIIARMPRAVCVMKKSILRNPVLGGGARLAGYIANEGTTRMIRDAAHSLTSGGQLLLFPEGTRTKTGERWINPLKGGCAIIALRAKVPVHPVFIRSNTRFLEKGWPVWKRPVFPLRISLETGFPLIPGENETPQEFTKRLETVFEKELSKAHPLRRKIEAKKDHS